MREWVAGEDQFALKQAKKGAQIRVREGRAKAIDWLAAILSILDPVKDLLDDDMTEGEQDIMDPQGVIENLNAQELQDLEKSVDHYLVLETVAVNRVFWNVGRVLARFEFAYLTDYRR
jgi:hypothetical protein